MHAPPFLNRVPLLLCTHGRRRRSVASCELADTSHEIRRRGLERVARYICVTCGVQYPEANHPPDGCPICEDDRQFVGWDGQQWTTLEAMHVGGYRNRLAEEEQGLTSILTEPRFAIGQRAFVVRTPHGNVLWDCVAYLDQRTIEAVRALGGIAAIAIS